MQERWVCLFLGLALTGIGGWGFGFEEDEPYGPQPQGMQHVEAWTEAQRARHASNPDMLVRPGVVADRNAQEVQVLAEATGLPTGDTPEFLLIDKGSGHGYEALLWSMAKPSDVHDGLVFIGLQPGGGIDPAALRFWSQGDPVSVVVALPGMQRFPIEELVFDIEAGQPLKEEGFVFTGSQLVDLPDGGDQPGYAADVYDPRAILPLYNDPGAVLDLPRQAHQGEMYGRYAANPEYGFEPGQMLTVVMMPGASNGIPARLAYGLEVTTAPTNANLFFRLRKQGVPEPLLASPELTPVLERLVVKEDDRQMIEVGLDFAADIPIGGLGRFCHLLALMETFGEIRVKEPTAGNLYYRAFAPSPRWRAPEGRPVQPWELHLTQAPDGVKGQLVLHEQIPQEAGSTNAPAFRQITHAVQAPADVPRLLLADASMRQSTDAAQVPAVILVFADATLAYGTLMQYLAPVLETHGTVYVFTDQKEKE